jgi:hypothetical protein
MAIHVATESPLPRAPKLVRHWPVMSEEAERLMQRLAREWERRRFTEHWVFDEAPSPARDELQVMGFIRQEAIDEWVLSAGGREMARRMIFVVT